MNKILPIIVLLTSTSIGAHGPFQSGFFNQGLNNGFWHNFDQKFQQIDHQLKQLKHSSNTFRTQSRQYFDKNNNSYIVEIKISGLNKNDIDISTKNNRLIIKGTNSSEKTSNNQNSRSSLSFSHSLSIPDDSDKDNISADFKDDILKVSIPKLNKSKPQIQKITIQ